MTDKYTESEKSTWNKNNWVASQMHLLHVCYILDIVSGPVGEIEMVKMIFAIKKCQTIKYIFKLLTKCFNSGNS